MSFKYYAIPKNNGSLDMDYRHLREGVQVNENSVYCAVDADAEVKESWKEITEEDFNQAKAAIMPPPLPTEPTNAEIKELLLATMAGIADLYTTILSGGRNQ